MTTTMVSTADISSLSYRNFTGPFYRGTQHFVLPERPSPLDSRLAVTVATESGSTDAYNGYDGQFCSISLLQFRERAQFSASKLLGLLCWDDECRKSFQDGLAELGVSFRQEAKRWFFYLGEMKVDTELEQQQLFYKSATGEKGSWDDESTTWSKKLAAVIINLLAHPRAQPPQYSFASSQLTQFAFGPSAQVIAQAPNTAIGQAFVAAYLSFAVNNPVRANAMLATTGSPRWDKDWLISVLQALTFKPGIAIYPARYNAIRPVLEKLYGLDLPDFADELKVWQRENDLWLVSVEELQSSLTFLGYDLGHEGLDSRFGDKTREALLSFQQTHNCRSVDGYPDSDTTHRLEDVLAARGAEVLMREQ